MAKRICTVDDCDRPAIARGWCTRHYQLWQRSGTPLGVGTPKGAAKQWLDNIAADTERTGCRDWPFALTTDGRPILRIAGRTRSASQVVLELVGHSRPQPPGNNALHSCDRSICVAPWHLRWGTPRDNVVDRDTRGRGRWAVGDSNGNAKLTAEDVAAIRARHGGGHGGTTRALAAEYGVTMATIQLIGRGATWKHQLGAESGISHRPRSANTNPRITMTATAADSQA